LRQNSETDYSSATEIAIVDIPKALYYFIFTRSGSITHYRDVRHTDKTKTESGNAKLHSSNWERSVTDIEILLAIEEIKRVKSNYFYGLDHKDWELWQREVWAPDASLIVPEADMECVGIDAILAYVTASTSDQVSVHHGHMPDIRIRSDTAATGVWAMEDRLFRTRQHPLADGSTYLHGFGHYHETYVRLPVGWRISSTRLTRLRVETSRVSEGAAPGARSFS
jgi:hypothetical protein